MKFFSGLLAIAGEDELSSLLTGYLMLFLSGSNGAVHSYGLFPEVSGIVLTKE